MERHAVFKFRLYIAGDTQNSAHAIANLSAFCLTHFQELPEIEVVDVFREPRRALADGILMTPTLIKVSPLPVRRVVGTLSHSEPLLLALGLKASAA